MGKEIITEMRKKRWRRCTALFAASIMLATTGCGVSDAIDGLMNLEMSMIGVNSTISEDSKWINSSIAGGIDSSVDVSYKDDYYTAMNKEWLLSTELPYAESEHQDENVVSILSDANQDIVKERKLAILKGDAQTLAENAPTQMTQEQTDRLQAQISHFADLYDDQEARDQMGMEPLRKYVEAISNVSNLNEMSDLILNGDLNYSNNYLAAISVDRIRQDDSRQYSVILDPLSVDLSMDYRQYSELSEDERSYMNLQMHMQTKMLVGLGYSETEAERLVTAARRYEIRLANVLEKVSFGDGSSDSYYASMDKTNYSLDDIAAMQGDFPLLEVLESIGVADSEMFTIYYPKALKGLYATYKESCLEEIKAYYITSLLRQTGLLVSTDIRDMYFDYLSEVAGEDQTMESDEELLTMVSSYMEEPVEELYAMYYCTTDDKEAILELTDMLIDACREMINSEEWLSDTTKERAEKKLDELVVHALYADTFEDYSGLDILSCENLIDAMSKIYDYNTNNMSRKVNQTYDRSSWSMTGDFATSVINAGYVPEENAIYIHAGICASGQFYSRDQSLEENLGFGGAVIGHEIGHAFDSTGYQYDEVGIHNNWWEREDIDTYELRVDKLVKAYNVLHNYHTGSAIAGSKLSGEAIGDMVGIKSDLIIASHQESFDYEKFFESYAWLWRQKASFLYLENIYKIDPHPASFLRVNMTLAQFDEFVETYDLKEGDGMYIAPEDRVAVW